VADVVLALADILETVVVPAGVRVTEPDTSQSPAVKRIDVTFAATPVVNETGVLLADEICSPIYPAAAVDTVVTPRRSEDGIVALAVQSAADPLQFTYPVKALYRGATEKVCFELQELAASRYGILCPLVPATFPMSGVHKPAELIVPIL
jgi:hypothetical protein